MAINCTENNSGKRPVFIMQLVLIKHNFNECQVDARCPITIIESRWSTRAGLTPLAPRYLCV